MRHYRDAMTAESSDYTATLPQKRMGAGVLITDADGRVLLVEPTYKAYWEIPGGAIEADESPHAAAARELKEELGLPVRVGRLLVTDWVPPRSDRTEGLMLVFDGGVLTEEQEAQIRLPAEELRGWAWCTEPEASERLSELLARRVSAALQARGDGSAVYLENGFYVG
jgi:8-oxo-dGTP diphosphatase